MTIQDYFGVKDTFDTGSGQAVIYRLAALEKHGFNLQRLPFSIRILLEAALRQADGFEITREAIETIAQWGPQTSGQVEIPFKPARVVLQDFTGVPSVVDLAALRNAMERMGGDPEARQSAGAGRSGRRPFGPGRPIWQRTGAFLQCRT